MFHCHRTKHSILILTRSSFVDRFIPGYIFFAHGVKHGVSAEAGPPWKGNGLCITIGDEREVLRTERF